MTTVQTTMLDVREDGSVIIKPNTHALLLRAVAPCDDHPDGAIEGGMFVNDETDIDTSHILEILHVLAFCVFNKPEIMLKLHQEAVLHNTVGNA